MSECRKRLLAARNQVKVEFCLSATTCGGRRERAGNLFDIKSCSGDDDNDDELFK
jgi:hypothetical protein